MPTGNQPATPGDPAAPSGGNGGAGGAAGGQGGGNASISPLVLDLSGFGIKLTTLTSSSPYFDLTNDGFAQKTGWIGAGTGLLVLPNASDGVSSIAQLFGQYGSFADGFAALGALDANGDGVINASDPIFSQLRVWVNPEADGIVHPGELLTLAGLGIASIKLAASASTEVIAGNAIKLTSTYTLTDGSTRAIDDAWFQTSPTYTRPDVATVLSPTVAALPYIPGNGTLPGLQVAMMADPALLSLVQAFVANPGQATLASVKAIMLEWSASTGIAPASRGVEFNAQQLDFLEKYTGIPFSDKDNLGNGDGQTANPRWASAISLREGWNSAEDGIAARLILQSSPTLVPEFTYNPTLDMVLPTTNLSASLSAIETRLGALTAANASQWDTALRVADASRLDVRLAPAPYVAVVSSSTSHSVAALASAIIDGLTTTVLNDGSIVLNGATANAVIYAGPQVRSIQISGEFTFAPTALADTIVYQAGDGVLDLGIKDYSFHRNSVLSLGDSTTAAQVSAYTDTEGNTYVFDGTAGDRLKIEDQKDTSVYQGTSGIQAVQFADGSSLTSAQLLSLEVTGTAGADTLIGGSTAQAFDGLSASTGSQDTEHGRSGNDVFVFNAGYGQLEIDEASATLGGISTLSLGAGIVPAHLGADEDTKGNLTLTDGIPGDQIVIDGMFATPAAGSSLGVDQVMFSDGTTWTRQQLIALATTGQTPASAATPVSPIDQAILAATKSALASMSTDPSIDPTTGLHRKPEFRVRPHQPIPPGSPNKPDPAAPSGGSGGAGGAAGGQGGGNASISPLVLDLNGSGVHLTALTQASPYFDLKNDGFAQKTGWINSGTGLLVLPDSTGAVTSIAQLFGQYGSFADGFAALGALDANGDGVINASDPIFSQLRVWVNPEADGIVHPGELLTLAGLGIASIKLAASASTEVIAGNAIKLTSTYTLTDGSTRAIDDAWFQTSPTYTRPDVATVLSPTVAALPYIPGNGTLPGLQVAMMADPALLSLVQAFVANPGQATLASVKAIMLEWSASTGIAPASRGVEFNAQQLDFLEKYTGIPFSDKDNLGNGDGQTANPRWASAISLREGWNSAEDGIAARLILQSSPTLVPEFTYNPTLDMVLPTTNLSASLSAIETRLGALTAANASQWDTALRVADASRLDVRLAPAPYVAVVSSSTSHSVAALASAIIDGLTATVSTDGIAISGTTTNSEIYAGPQVRSITVSGEFTFGTAPLGDVIAYQAGDGTLELAINDYSFHRNSVIELGGAITSSGLSVSSDVGGNVFLTDGTAGDQIKIDGQKDYSVYQNTTGIQAVQFADGTILTAAQLVAMADTGTSAADTLYGTPSADTFDGKGALAGSKDVEHGLGGGDTFVFNAGYGSLEIDETDYTATASNVLALGSAIAPGALVATHDSAGNMILSDGVAGDQIQIDGLFNASYMGVQSVAFSGGVTWTRQQLLTLADTGSPMNISLFGTSGADTFDGKGYATSETGNGGADTFLYMAGYGSLEINEIDSTLTTISRLSFGAGITSTQVQVGTDGHDNVVLTDGTSGDKIVLDGMLSTSPLGVWYGVRQVSFADGTTWSQQQLLTLAETGSPSNTELYGLKTADVLDSKGYATYAQGNGGGDTFVYAAGYGKFEIAEVDYAAVPNNVISFEQGILPSQLVITRDDAGNMYIADGVAGDQIKLDYQLGSGTIDGVQAVHFADGTVWSKAQLAALVTVPAGNQIVGSPSVTTLTGTAAAEVFDSKGYANYANGGGGGDTFIYKSGYGLLEIYELDFSSFTNVVQFGPDITAAQLTVSSDGSNLHITDGVAGDQVKIDNTIYGGVWGVQSVTFVDGSSLSRAQLLQLSTLVNGTKGADQLSGANGATFDGKGAPVGSQDYEQGYGNGNSYVFNRGYGQLEINASDYTSNPSSTLMFGSGITAAQLTAVEDSSGSVTLSDGSAGDTIKLDSQLSSSGYYGIDAIQFADGSVVNRQFISNLAQTATSTNKALYGFGHSDVFLVDAGFGSVEVNETDYSASDNNTLKLGSSITVGQVSATTDSSRTVTISDGVAGDQIKLDGQLSNSGYYGVGTLLLGDGTTLTRQQISNLAQSASSTNRLIYGFGDTDAFSYNAGTGAVEINETDYSSGARNALHLGSGIVASQLTATTDGSGAVIIGDGVSGDAIKLDGQLNSSGYYGLGSLQLADGTTLTRQQISNLAQTASSTNRVIHGLGDTDVFSYGAGTGAVEINETDYSSSAKNTLDLGSGIVASQLTATTDSSGAVIIGDGVSGDAIKLDGQLNNSGYYGVGSLQLSDGTTFTRQQISDLSHVAHINTATLFGFGNSDVFTYSAGTGPVEVNETDYASSPNNILKILGGVTAAQLTAISDPSNDLFLQVGGSDVVKLTGQLNSSDYNGVGAIQLDDGTSLNRAQITALLSHS